MKTAERLESMSDVGAFEKLATAVLRWSDSDYMGIIHTGINAQGKTITDPLDGIVLVPGSSPSLYVAVQHTTCLQSKLRSKWLGENEDIDKSSATIRSIRQTDVTARLRLGLTTNRKVDSNLYSDVQAKARTEGIEIDVFEQSVISAFLDNDPDGQWLRRNFFGLSQQRLSFDLLADISRRSAADFRDQVLDDPAAWVDRELDELLESDIERWSGATFLLMPSGTGKTTAAARLLSRWVEDGNFGLWLPPSVVENAVTLDNSIQEVLLSYEPDLDVAAVQVARELSDKRLLLIVDDINDSDHTERLLRKVLSWMESSSALATRSECVHTICPVWPQTVNALADTPRKLLYQHAVVQNAFSSNEARAAVLARAAQNSVSLSAVKADELAKALGYDPLLIALAAGEEPSADRATSVKTEFVQHQCSRCASLPGSTLSELEYYDALRSLGQQMLERKMLRPLWPQVRSWFVKSTHIVAALRELAKQRQVIHITTEEGVVGFRHDAVRNNILASAIDSWRDGSSVPDAVLADPYFAEVIGESLIMSRNALHIKSVSHSNPLALFCALRIGLPAGCSTEKNIVAAIHGWINSDAACLRASRALINAIHWELANTDHSVASEIADEFGKPSHLLDLARFRNGDLNAGVRVCYRLDPSINSPPRDALIQHVLGQRGVGFNQDLSALLTEDLDEKTRIGALYLAGFIGDTTLSPAITAAWKENPTPTLLGAFIWTAIRCAGANPQEMLEPVLLAWSKLPEFADQDERDKPYQSQAVTGSRWKLAESCSEPVLRYMVKAAEIPNFRWSIRRLLERVDHPIAVEFIAREMAVVADEIKASDGFSPWLNDLIQKEVRRVPALGDASRRRLEEIWGSKKESATLRLQSFKLWAADADLQDVSKMRVIGEDEPMYEWAIRTRMTIADESAVPVFIRLLGKAKHRSYWWQFARHFWCEALAKELDRELDRRAAATISAPETMRYESDWITSSLLMNMNSADAERLIERHWCHLQYRASFVLAALFVATPRCQQLVASTVSNCAEPAALFEYMNQRWLIGGTSQLDRLSTERLRSLEPYLDDIGEQSIHSLWTACNLDSFHQWRRQHLDHRLTVDWQLREGVTDEGLMADLDKFAARDRSFWPDYWLQAFEARADEPSRVYDVLRTWLTSRGTLRAMEVVGECLVDIGNRTALQLLNEEGTPIGPDADEIRRDVKFALYRRTIDP